MIGRALHLARKLRGRSVAELRERLGQATAAAAERHSAVGRGTLAFDGSTLARRLAADVPRDPAALLERFRLRAPARAFAGLADPEATVTALRDRAPGHEAHTVARAEELLRGRFDLLGYEGLSFGAPIDWHLDPVAGRRAPMVHWSRVPYLSYEQVGDHKVTWELNRMQWLVTLGQAYWYTGDERYAAGFADAVSGWLDANPPKVGINWASSLEVAFRAMSWLWALLLFRHSPALTPTLFARMLHALDVHGRHLERYLSTYFSPNTHLTGEALGLAHLGMLLPELARAPAWRARGQGIMEAQLAVQVRPDGTYFEQATQYHRYTAEFYLHLLLLAESNGVQTSAALRTTLRRLMDVLLWMARPDGTIPLFGDDDGGRLVQLDDCRPSDVRALLATAAGVLGRGEYAWAGGGDVAPLLWLLGPGGLARHDALASMPPAEGSRGFTDGGFYVMRDGWGGDGHWLAVDAGPHGSMNCGHAHADALSIEVAVDGRPVLVDAGTYSYPGPERDAFRSASAHNTATIDGRSSSEPGSAFQWRSMAMAQGERWLSTSRFDYFEGSHDGYRTLGAEHRRSILFVKGAYWIVRDRIVSVGASLGEHTVECRFHAAPRLGMCNVADGSMAEFVDEDDRLLLRLAAFGQGARVEVEDGWVSPTYGLRHPARVAVVRQRGGGDHDIVTWLLPAGVEGTAPMVREVPCDGGRAFIVARDEAEDLLVLGDGRLMRVAGVETDASWTWLRRAADGAGDCLTLGASHLQVAGSTIFRGAERAELRVDALPGGAGIAAPARAED